VERVKHYGNRPTLLAQLKQRGAAQAKRLLLWPQNADVITGKRSSVRRVDVAVVDYINPAGQWKYDQVSVR